MHVSSHARVPRGVTILMIEHDYEIAAYAVLPSALPAVNALLASVSTVTRLLDVGIIGRPSGWRGRSKFMKRWRCSRKDCKTERLPHA
jgi:hypothetical protein